MNDILTRFGTHDIQILASAVFGRDIARLHQLIEFLTWLSIILWGIVMLTTLIYFSAYFVHTWSRRRLHKRNRHSLERGHGSY